MSPRSFLKTRTRHWLWFFGLWIVGFGGTAALVYLVKWAMGL